MKDAILADEPEKGTVLVRIGDIYKIQKKPKIVYEGDATLTERLLEEGGKKYVSIAFYTSPFLAEPNKYFKALESIFDGKHLELSYPKQKIELSAIEKDTLTKMFPLGFCGKFENQDVKGRIAAKAMSEGDSVRIDVEYEDIPNKSLLRLISKMLLKVEPDTSYFNRKKGYYTQESVMSPEKVESDIFRMNPRNFDGIVLPTACD